MAAAAATTIQKFKAKDKRELRKKSKKDLLKQVDDLKKELHQLRVTQKSGGAPAKVSQIRVVRKNIARINTIVTQITKQKVKETYVKQKSLLPLDLRPKLTRRERLRLPKEYRFKKTTKQLKNIKKYPQRKFAILNLRYRLPKEIRALNLHSALTGKHPGNQYFQHLRRNQNLRRRIRAKTQEQKQKKKEEKQKQQQKQPKTEKKEKKQKETKENKENKSNETQSDAAKLD